MSLDKAEHGELHSMLKKWEAHGAGSAYIDLKMFLDSHPYTPPEDAPRCEIAGCTNEPVYNAWLRNRDPFTRNPTGLISQVSICEEHKTHPWLCANETKEEAYGTSATKDATS